LALHHGSKSGSKSRRRTGIAEGDELLAQGKLMTRTQQLQGVINVIGRAIVRADRHVAGFHDNLGLDRPVFYPIH
jgi:hypothetical protein